jgi:hypothetical protein
MTIASDIGEWGSPGPHDFKHGFNPDFNQVT